MESIKQYGILSVAELLKSNIPFFQNDHKRLDQRLDRISCSVTVHNHYLLEDFHKKIPRKWIEIRIKPTVCALKDCEFFYTNAANSVFQSPEYDTSSSKAFSEMFRNPIEYPTAYQHRTLWRNDKPINQPTDVQAEIMVKGKIPRKFLVNWDYVKIGEA